MEGDECFEFGRRQGRRIVRLIQRLSAALGHLGEVVELEALEVLDALGRAAGNHREDGGEEVPCLPVVLESVEHLGRLFHLRRADVMAREHLESHVFTTLVLPITRRKRM